MRKFRRNLCLILMFAITVGGIIFSPTETVQAAESAKSLVSSALKNMKTYDTISYSYNLSATLDREVWRRTGMCISDMQIEHGYYLDTSESEKGWEQYTKRNKIYRKSYSDSEWKIYTDTDYNSKSINSYTDKKFIQYLLGHLKEMKITSRSSNSYTITAKPNYKNTNIKKVTMTVNKKKKCMTSIKFAYKTSTGTYLDSEDTYTVKNKTVTWSNICYGKGKLKIPNGL